MGDDQGRTPLEDWLGQRPAPEDLRLVDQVASTHSGQSADAVRAAIRATGLRIPAQALDELATRISRLEKPPRGAVRAIVRGHVRAFESR